MATLRMPDRIARELVAYCIDAAAPSRADELLRLLISALGELRIESAHIEARDGGRHADVVVDADDAEAFRTVFPHARLLRIDTPRGLVFRLSGDSSHAAATRPA